ncbi:MAG: glycosyl hydrolase family 18 protein, partial [Bacteroidales bacterium]
YEAVLAHIRAGFPRNKLVLGIPFYGKPGKDFPKGANDYGQLIKLADYEQKWDDIAKAPYLTGPGGEIVCTYDDPRSIGYKCRFILKYGLRGAMFWDYNGDDEQGSLRKAIYDGILLP